MRLLTGVSNHSSFSHKKDLATPRLKSCTVPELALSTGSQSPGEPAGALGDMAQTNAFRHSVLWTVATCHIIYAKARFLVHVCFLTPVFLCPIA